MSQADIDHILKKYDKNVQKPRIDYMHTQRKRQVRDQHAITFMDNNYTPAKEARENNYALSNQQHRIQQILRQLDASEKNYAISQKNYAQMSRKYDKLKHAYDMVSVELEKERKIRLQQLIDFQNKLELLQVQNGKNLTKLQSKQHSIAILKQKLCQKQSQVVIFQQQLQQISQRLCYTLQLKNKQSAKTTTQLFQSNTESMQLHLDHIKTKYQKSIAALNQQLAKMTKQLQQKQKEKKKLLYDMDDMSKKHLEEIRELNQVLSKNEGQYKLWLDQSKREKIQTMEKYEHEIRQLRKMQLFYKLGKSDDMIQMANKTKPLIKQLQAINTNLLLQIKSLKSQIQTTKRSQKQSQIKQANSQQQLKHIKSQLVHQISQNKKLLNNLETQQQKYEKLRATNNTKQMQLEAIKIKYSELQNRNGNLEKQVQMLRADMGRQLKSLIHVKKQLNQATNNQLNMNSTLTHTVIKLQQKIKRLQVQIQTITTQLYAQRLQKAKLSQQLQQTKINLKQEYDLSLQNTRRQLQQKIKENLNVKSQRDIECEKLYLQLFKIQRQYQLLKSQVITSEEMLKLGTKMGKYYQRKTK